MKKIFFLLLLFSLISQAQFRINGIVKEATTNKPLPFATILSDKGFETVTDIDGKFIIDSHTEIQNLEISYVGFQKKKIITGDKKYFTVALSQEKNTAFNTNTANAIMTEVIALRKANNPEKKLQTFQFKTYNNLLITANPDSINGALDSVFVKKKKIRQFSKIDSSNFKFKKLITSQHLFQTEKISQFQHSKQGTKETILGIKMSGFNQPVYEIVGFNLQSFSVYENTYALFETQYKNPIARGAFQDYSFELLDTVTYKNRAVSLIYFKPINKHKTLGLQGLLFVDQKSYAVAKVIFRVKGVLDITAIHDFEYLEAHDLWFPTAKECKIVKGKKNGNIKILGEIFQFDADDNDVVERKRQSSDYAYVISKSNNFDFQYNLPLQIKKAAIAIEIDDEAVKKTDVFYAKYRNDSLDNRSQNTYYGLDSIVKKEKVEKKIRIGRRVLNGYLPLGPIDFDLRQLLSYNNYEGLRLGLGGITNDKFSKVFRIESYGAYGTKDGVFKYNFGAATRIGKFSNTWIGGGYTNDVREIASISFAVEKKNFKLYDPRPINVSTFYNHQTWRGYIESKIIPKTESIWQFSHSVVTPKFNYIFNLNGKSYTVFNMTTAMVSLQWNPFSDYMQTPTGRLEIEKNYPKFIFQFTKSLPNVLENDFEFSKIDIRAEFQKKYLNGQKTTFLAEVGYATGDIPLTHLYNTSPNNLTKDNIIQRVTIAGKNSFETMYFNEFFSSQYVFFQLKHGLKKIELFKKVKPALVFVTRMAWGNMEHPEQHVGINYKTLNEGFFESGLELNQIYKGFGLSGFYRYGPNQLSRFEDNIAIKLNFVFDLGI